MDNNEFDPPRGRALDGKSVLLIVIPSTRMTRAHFYSGIAVCDGRSIGMRPFLHHKGVPPIAAPPEALQGFDLELLRHLILPEHHDYVAHLACGVEVGVVVFADDTPAGGLVIEEAFFGLARGAAGEPLLMRGDPQPKLRHE